MQINVEATDRNWGGGSVRRRKISSIPISWVVDFFYGRQEE
jgi:hypothetical protein